MSDVADNVVADAGAVRRSPYELIGGAEGVRRLADKFYDLMDQDPRYQELRDMHEPDLAPMRDSLAGFFSVWLGGPRHWIEKRGGFCIMSRHAKMNVTQKTADQWMDAIRRAIAEIGMPPELAEKMDKALAPLAEAMARLAKG
ncbi:group II truncated hemoglobin [Acidocella sp.]|uniref:group II truncated hemoglobin n=1 Tax=Acidocella sp. TaxID=50710 RepID=UPI002601E4AB|nr:group II truncated hemoglobin [Acidocella sp.]